MTDSSDIDMLLVDWLGESLQTSNQLVSCIFPETGRGLKTLQAIPGGSVLLAMSHSRCFTARTVALTVGAVPPFLRSHPIECLVLFILLEDFAGVASLVAPYIQSLPRTFSNPLFTLSGVLPSSLPKDIHSLLCQQRDEMKSSWQILDRAFNSSELLQWKSVMCRRRFLWAWFVVSTRSLYIRPEVPALLPFVDLLNHFPTAKTKTRYNDRTKEFEIITEDSYGPGDQVFINYGNHDNLRLAVYYGFTVPGNPYNDVALDADEIQQTFYLSPEKRLFMEHYGVWNKFSCSTFGLSMGMVILLRLCESRGCDLWKLLDVETPSNISSFKKSQLQKLLTKETVSRSVALQNLGSQEMFCDLVREQLDILRRNLENLDTTEYIIYNGSP